MNAAVILPDSWSLIPRAVGFGGAILLCVALAYFIFDRRWTKKKSIMKKSRGVVALQIIQESLSNHKANFTNQKIIEYT
ncbi:hypothetical protein HN51_028296, partial [Arachis hypogaea]